jgi:hypothetical protein
MHAARKTLAVLASATALIFVYGGTALADTASDNAAAAGAVTTLGGGLTLFVCCYALLILLSIGLAIFNLFMWYDAAMRDKADYPNNNKSMWIILLILLNFWAALFYYFMVKRQK